MNRKILIYTSMISIIVVLLSSTAFLYISACKIEKERLLATEPTEQTVATEMAVEASGFAATRDDSDSYSVQIQTEEGSEIPEPTEPLITEPGELTEILAECYSTTQQLYDLGCKQLVTVRSYGANAGIDFYTFNDGAWLKNDSFSCQGYVGSNGVTEDMHEGGRATPKGLYSVGDAFYIYSRPETGLSVFEVTNDTYWVDDPDSAYYNQRVEGTANKDWTSAEHMIDYTSAYEYGFVINYNLEARYNAGSAIFFHVSSAPTAGCVATDRTMVLKYLAELDAGMNPYILIV